LPATQEVIHLRFLFDTANWQVFRPAQVRVFLTQMLAPPPGNIFRHCEGRRPAEIQTAFRLALASRKDRTAAWIATSLSAPRNDEAGGVTTLRSSLLTEILFGLQFVDLL
jgi:hypothetical protein